MNKRTKKDLADTIGIRQQSLAAVLNGHRRLAWEKAKHIARITGTCPEDWMNKDRHKMAVGVANFIHHDQETKA